MYSKRDHIVTAALRRYRVHGVCGTTLKDVAEVSGVPLGNLYYYFKTRSELVLAVLDECERELRALLARLAPLAPEAWLTAYFSWLLQDPDGAARLGCPFGTLAAELRALGDPAAPRAAEIVRAYAGAVRAQALALALSPEAAEDVFLTVQGAYTVSRALGDAALFSTAVERLRARTLGPGGPASGQG